MQPASVSVEVAYYTSWQVRLAFTSKWIVTTNASNLKAYLSLGFASEVILFFFFLVQQIVILLHCYANNYCFMDEQCQ